MVGADHVDASSASQGLAMHVAQSLPAYQKLTPGGQQQLYRAARKRLQEESPSEEDINRAGLALGKRDARGDEWLERVRGDVAIEGRRLAQSEWEQS
jgi:hypothetical protein